MYEEYEEKIRKFKDIYKGRRCFVMGTGPSLNKINKECLKYLENEIIIGVTDGYRIRERSNINFKFFATSNGPIWAEHYSDMLNLDTNLFLEGAPAQSYIANKEKFDKIKKCEIFLLKDAGRIREQNFIWNGQDLSKGCYSGIQVITQMALPIAYYIGCEKTYIIGIDFDRDTTGYHFFKKDGKAEPNAPMRSNTYWATMAKEYDSFRVAFEVEGRKIYNATYGGKLEAFERVNLEDLFHE